MMQPHAPARDAPDDPGVLRLPPAALVVVHAGHVLRVLAALPGPSGLLVHDTGTRDWRRRLLAGLARRCGRGAHLLLVEIPPRRVEIPPR
jgi:hypothetical protein